MVFSSPLFLGCFLPVLLAAYFCAPRRARNAVLLAGSVFFYAWGEPKAVFLLLALAILNWRAGLAMSSALGAGRAAAARRILFAGVAANLAALGIFKYASFAAENLRALGIPAPDPGIALPLGVSFYVFQCISYLADVSRGDTRAERGLADFALYVSLFPQLVAGPIVRHRQIADEIAQRREDVAGFADGMARFGRGLAKKVIVADTLAAAADAAFPADISALPQAMAWFGVLCYAMQIYYDFSGYSDMAIGLGRVFGFRFPENFDHPYCACDVREFWRRWHMSLSSWFRDYVYIPLGGSRRGAARTYRNLVVVFALCGLWHGASWCFVLWGLWHGAGLVFERLAGGARRAEDEAPLWRRCLGNARLWLFVLVGWVPFKAGTEGYGVGYAARYLRTMFLGNPGHGFFSWWPALGATAPFTLVVLAAALVISYGAPARRLCPDGSAAASRAVAFALFAAAFAFAMTSGYSPFIYFRF